VWGWWGVREGRGRRVVDAVPDMVVGCTGGYR
jgi:hypothetical protein